MPLKILLLACLLSSVSGFAKEEINILFLGNSYTFRHELPSLVETVLEEGMPDTEVNVTRVTYGGQNMFKHSTYYSSQSFIEQNKISNEEIAARIAKMKALLDSNAAPNPAEWKAHAAALGQEKAPAFASIHKQIKRAISMHEKLLKENPRTEWDYVVMQSWRDVSADPNEAYGKYVQKLAETVRENGAEVILYMTSPETQNAEPVTEPIAVDKADRDVAVGIALAKSIKPKAVVHVPMAIKMIQTGGTDLLFRYVNDGHPNQTCAFLTSNLFYAAFTGKSPEGFAYDTVVETKVDDGKDPDGGPLKVTFDSETKRLIQKTAYEAAQEFKRLSGE